MACWWRDGGIEVSKHSKLHHSFTCTDLEVIGGWSNGGYVQREVNPSSAFDCMSVLLYLSFLFQIIVSMHVFIKFDKLNGQWSSRIPSCIQFNKRKKKKKKLNNNPMLIILLGRNHFSTLGESFVRRWKSSCKSTSYMNIISLFPRPLMGYRWGPKHNGPRQNCRSLASWPSRCCPAWPN